MSRKIRFIFVILVVGALATSAARAVPFLPGAEQTTQRRESIAAVTLSWMGSLLKAAERTFNLKDTPPPPPKEGTHLDPDGNK